MNIVGITTSTADRKRRAGQRLIIGLEGTSLNEQERSFIKEARPGGFILFKRNVEDRPGLRLRIAVMPPFVGQGFKNREQVPNGNLFL